jgi:hypothetical protein
MLHLDPCIPRAWHGFKVRFRHHSARYEDQGREPSRRDAWGSRVEFDGAPLADGAAITLADDGATHRVRVVLGLRDIGARGERRCRLSPPARSAVTAAVTSASRRAPVERRAALPAAPGAAARPRTVVEDLDLAGVDELPELRMLGGLRGDLSSLSRAEVQGLAAGQRDAQRFPGLVGNGLHRCLVIRQVAERYFLPFPGIEGVWR